MSRQVFNRSEIVCTIGWGAIIKGMPELFSEFTIGFHRS
ncbi:MAG: hypothetical protein JWN25_387 [Verrucomicrobiales bacterium]|nr:hypothetical protein [Verrucomicrobiales bacterium]